MPARATKDSEHTRMPLLDQSGQRERWDRLAAAGEADEIVGGPWQFLEHAREEWRRLRASSQDDLDILLAQLGFSPSMRRT